MCKKIILVINFLGICSGLFSQNTPTKKELKFYHEIYGIAIDSFLNTKPTFFFLVDSPDNRRIKDFNFTELVDDLSRTKYTNLNSDWLDFLKECDNRKFFLQSFSLKPIKSIHSIKLTNKDTLFKILSEQYKPGNDLMNKYGWINGWMTISNVILSKKKNKAIVEISHTISSLNGQGAILLLQKGKKGKWIVIEKWRTWIA